MKAGKEDFLLALALGAIFVFLAFLVGANSEFPLNDDWSYSKTAFRFYDTGVLELDSWTSAIVIFEVFWAWPFLFVFGKSFFALRLSTIVLSFAGAVFFYAILRMLIEDRKKSFFGVIVYVLNPIYLNLTFSYMTDVPFVSFMLISAFFYILCFKNPKNNLSLAYFAVGSVFALFASLVRQLGVVVFASAAIFYLLQVLNGQKTSLMKFKIARKDMIAAGIIAVCLASFAVAYAWYSNQYTHKFAFSLNPAALAYILLNIALYTGLFLFPLLLLNIEAIFLRARKIAPIAIFFGVFLLFGIIALSIYKKTAVIMPILGNMIFDFGIGPPTLRDTYLLGYPYPISLPAFAWLAVTAISIVSAAIFLSIIALATWSFLNGKSKPFLYRLDVKTSFFLSIFAIILAIHVMISTFYDRYLIVFLPPAILVVLLFFRHPAKAKAAKKSRVGASLFLASIVLIAFFSAAAAQTYFSWNDARWKNINFLTGQLGISPESIDGGFEFNGFYGSFYDNVDNGDKWVPYDDYVISFNEMDGFEVIHSESYFSLLDFGHHKIYSLKKLGNS